MKKTLFLMVLLCLVLVFAGAYAQTDDVPAGTDTVTQTVSDGDTSGTNTVTQTVSDGDTSGTDTVTQTITDSDPQEGTDTATQAIEDGDSEDSSPRPKERDLIYDGSKQYLVEPNPKDQTPGTMTFYYQNSETKNWSAAPENTPYGVEANTYVVNYIYSDSEPALDAPYSTTYVSIYPRVAELAWSNTVFTADGKDHVPAANVTNLVKGDTCSVTVSGAQSKPGEYVAVASGLTNRNYVLPEEKQTQAFTINPGNGNHSSSGSGSTASDNVWYRLSSFASENTTLPATGFSTRIHTPLSIQPADLAYENLGMRIQIPTLNMDAELTGVPAMGNSWAVEWLGDRAGLLAGTANPGDGYSIIAAHNHLNTTEVGPFVLLSWLEDNDRIFVTTDDGDLTFFSVYANELLGPNDVEKMASIAEQEENSLILITCENESIDGGYLNRRVVFAKPLN